MGQRHYHNKNFGSSFPSLIYMYLFLGMFEILIKFYIITEACLKIHPRAKITQIEEAVSETLKHAPTQKDGPKYKKVSIIFLWWDYM